MRREQISKYYGTLTLKCKKLRLRTRRHFQRGRTLLSQKPPHLPPQSLQAAFTIMPGQGGSQLHLALVPAIMLVQPPAVYGQPDKEVRLRASWEFLDQCRLVDDLHRRQINHVVPGGS